jgi:hypothetical protein
MTEPRSRLGPIVSVSGAATLAVSVFLPWYSVTITADGAATAQQTLSAVAERYGNADLQAAVNALGAGFTTLAGHQVTTVSAHQLLKTIGVVLVLLAALAFFGALVWLAELDEVMHVDGGQVAAVGAVATVCVLYRMVDRPAPALDAFSLSLTWGAWLALGSSVAIVAGALVGRTADRQPARASWART